MTDKPPADWTAGWALLAGLARTGRVFTVNDGTVRDRLRALGFDRYRAGALFTAAQKSGLIRQVGVERSTDPRTRGAFVRQWTAGDAKPLPRRDPRQLRLEGVA